MNDAKATGSLQVKVSSADGAFPVEGAIVLISPNTAGGNGVIRSLRTDSSGLTETVSLPTKAGSLSESPGNGTPYLTYNVETKKEGYYTVNSMNVPIFDGIKARLPVDLVPLSFGTSEFDAGFDEGRQFNYIRGGALDGGADEL